MAMRNPFHALWPLASDLLRRSDSARIIIVIADDKTRQFRIMPREARISAALVVGVLTLLVTGLVAFTPIRGLIPGYGTAELRQNARLTSMRLLALQDSLDLQRQFMAHLQGLLTGEMAPLAEIPATALQETASTSGVRPNASEDPPSENWTDHEQPALPVTRMPTIAETPARVVSDGRRFLSGLRLPALSPVSGLISRGFDASTGHFAVDIATQEGTLVRAVGDGYVILADWTYKGGHTIAVQHADGYVSVYKHNERLLKRVADRVRLREAVAVSGNSGEYTTGPHLHFELWNNGLAQDPGPSLLGL